MKYIIFLSLLMLSFSSQAAPTCSRNGTTVIYTNGVTTKFKDAQAAMEKIEGLGLNSHIDLKTVNYDLAYNYAEGVAKDFLEVAVQRFPKRFLNELGTKDPYAAYEAYLNGKLSGAAYSNELNAISEEILNVLDSYIRDYANYSQYTQSVESIKSYYEAALNKGERVFAISHSQGGLFMRDAYDTLDVPAKNRFFSGFQIASPLNGVMNSHFGYATHEKDRLINTLRSFFGALPWNIKAPLFVSNSFEGISDYVVDFIINHGIVTTYLNDPTIKPKVISKLIKTAQLLESNCPTAVYYTPQGEGSAQIVNYLKPLEQALNIIDYDIFTSAMDENTKENLRFKLLVYPSENESLVNGIEHVSVVLSGGMDSELWSGNGSFPNENEFILNATSSKINVTLSNLGSENTVPVYTTIIPEIRKEICYGGPDVLRVTFKNTGVGILSDYADPVRGIVNSGTCQNFYLIYNTDYFFELLVSTSDPEAIGYLGNWDNGFVYNYRIHDSKPLSVSAKIVPLVVACPGCTPIPESEKQYKIDLMWLNVSPNSILVY